MRSESFPVSRSVAPATVHFSSGSDAYDISKLKALTKGEEPYEVTFGHSAALDTVTCGTPWLGGETDSQL